MSYSSRRAFTLIELLVVIAIIAVLSVVVILALNPAELLRQARDSQRVHDLATVKTALGIYLADNASPNLASSSFGYAGCYVSALSGGPGPTSTKCGVFTQTYTTSDASTTKVNYRKVDSTGWIPVNFTTISAGAPFGSLPVDPVNNTTTYYAYAATSTKFVYELNAFLESTKYAGFLTSDGGDNTSTYEIGTQPGLNL